MAMAMTRNHAIVLWLALLGGCGGGDGGSGGDGATTGYTVGVTVSGLTGAGLVLQNNGGDDLAIIGDGTYSFGSALGDGQVYAVTVASQPRSDRYCNVVDGVGTIAGGDVTDVTVRCIGGRYRIVDTGQTRCFASASGAEAACSGMDAATGTAQDADHAGTAPSYSVIGDGSMVLDDVTGLIWTRSSDTDGDGAVNAADKLYQADAAAYCAALDRGGYTWRLPNIKELYSLILFSGTDASTYGGTDTALLTPFGATVFDWAYGDTSAGERIIDGQYASSTLYVSTTMHGDATMFGVNFADGRIKGYPTARKAFYVRCVAGNTGYGSNAFVANGDGTVSDAATGLTWQQDDSGSSGWDDAVATCQAATTGGHDDWRLPNAKELQSLVDYGRSPDTSGAAAIAPEFNATQISNEGGAADWAAYWTSTTHETYDRDGLDNDGRDAVYLAFGRALGYFDGGGGSRQLLDVHGAGSQRSDNKVDASVNADGSANLGFGLFYYHGPQGDVLRLNNRVRCVRGG